MQPPRYQGPRSPASSRRRGLTILSLLLLGSLLALAAAAQDSEQTGPKAVVDELIHDFGIVTRTAIAEHVFVVENQGNEELVIRDVGSSCACTVAEYDKTIAPGESGKVRAFVDTDLINGAYQAVVSLFTNDPANPRLDLTLKVETRPNVHITPGYFRYVTHQNYPGEVAINQRVRAIEPKEFSIVRAESPYPFLKVTYRPLEGEELDPRHDGPEYLVTARLDKDAPVGALTGYIRLHFDHPKQKTAPIPLSGFVRPVFAVTPAQGNLRELAPEDEPIRASFHVKQFSEESIEIEEVVTDVQGLQLEVETIEEGRAYWLYVIIPTDMPKGPFSGTVTLKTSSDLDREVEVPIRGTVT